MEFNNIDNNNLSLSEDQMKQYMAISKNSSNNNIDDTDIDIINSNCNDNNNNYTNTTNKLNFFLGLWLKSNQNRNIKNKNISLSEINEFTKKKEFLFTVFLIIDELKTFNNSNFNINNNSNSNSSNYFLSLLSQNAITVKDLNSFLLFTFVSTHNFIFNNAEKFIYNTDNVLYTTTYYKISDFLIHILNTQKQENKYSSIKSIKDLYPNSSSNSNNSNNSNNYNIIGNDSITTTDIFFQILSEKSIERICYTISLLIIFNYNNIIENLVTDLVKNAYVNISNSFYTEVLLIIISNISIETEKVKNSTTIELSDEELLSLTEYYVSIKKELFAFCVEVVEVLCDNNINNNNNNKHSFSNIKILNYRSRNCLLDIILSSITLQEKVINKSIITDLLFHEIKEIFNELINNCSNTNNNENKENEYIKILRNSRFMTCLDVIEKININYFQSFTYATLLFNNTKDAVIGKNRINKITENENSAFLRNVHNDEIAIRYFLGIIDILETVTVFFNSKLDQVYDNYTNQNNNNYANINDLSITASISSIYNINSNNSNDKYDVSIHYNIIAKTKLAYSMIDSMFKKILLFSVKLLCIAFRDLPYLLIIRKENINIRFRKLILENLKYDRYIDYILFSAFSSLLDKSRKIITNYNESIDNNDNYSINNRISNNNDNNNAELFHLYSFFTEVIKLVIIKSQISNYYSANIIKKIEENENSDNIPSKVEELDPEYTAFINQDYDIENETTNKHLNNSYSNINTNDDSLNSLSVIEYRKYSEQVICDCLSIMDFSMSSFYDDFDNLFIKASEIKSKNNTNGGMCNLSNINDFYNKFSSIIEIINYRSSSKDDIFNNNISSMKVNDNNELVFFYYYCLLNTEYLNLFEQEFIYSNILDAILAYLKIDSNSYNINNISYMHKLSVLRLLEFFSYSLIKTNIYLSYITPVVQILLELVKCEKVFNSVSSFIISNILKDFKNYSNENIIKDNNNNANRDESKYSIKNNLIQTIFSFLNQNTDKYMRFNTETKYNLLLSLTYISDKSAIETDKEDFNNINNINSNLLIDIIKFPINCVDYIFNFLLQQSQQLSFDSNININAYNNCLISEFHLLNKLVNKLNPTENNNDNYIKIVKLNYKKEQIYEVCYLIISSLIEKLDKMIEKFSDKTELMQSLSKLINTVYEVIIKDDSNYNNNNINNNRISLTTLKPLLHEHFIKIFVNNPKVFYSAILLIKLYCIELKINKGNNTNNEVFYSSLEKLTTQINKNFSLYSSKIDFLISFVDLFTSITENVDLNRITSTYLNSITILFSTLAETSNIKIVKQIITLFKKICLLTKDYDICLRLTPLIITKMLSLINVIDVNLNGSIPRYEICGFLFTITIHHNEFFVRLLDNYLKKKKVASNDKINSNNVNSNNNSNSLDTYISNVDKIVSVFIECEKQYYSVDFEEKVNIEKNVLKFFNKVVSFLANKINIEDVLV